MAQKNVFCHFSFRRPRGKGYGLFAAALYRDSEGKDRIAVRTRAFSLWKDHQHVTAIQAYEHALYCIWEWQAKLKQYGVTNVYMVTDNSTLAGWIMDPSKNKMYTGWMRKANSQYKSGGPKEILIPIGLCETRKSEKSHKYCVESRVLNKIPDSNQTQPTGYKIPINNYKSATDIIKEDIPEGMDSMGGGAESVFTEDD